MSKADRRGRWWPWAVAALLALMGSMMAILFWLAVSDPTHVVEEDYYERAVDWDETAAQREADLHLGWLVTLEFREVPVNLMTSNDVDRPNTMVVAAIVDSLGMPVTGLAVSLRAFFSARADRVYADSLAPVTGGYGAAFRLGPPGVWEFRLSARRDSTFFTWSGTRELGAVK